MAFGVCTNCTSKQFSTFYWSKMEFLAKYFFDTLTIYNDEIRYVEHVLAPFYGVFRLFVVTLHVVRLPS